jgi:hypothetical protein
VVVGAFSFSLPFANDEGFDWGVGRPLRVLPDPTKAGGVYITAKVSRRNAKAGQPLTAPGASGESREVALGGGV